MGSIVLIAYGLYLTMVGVRGNAPTLLADLAQEQQFVYWILVLMVVAGLWESPAGERIAKPFAALIVVGFLLKNNNWQTIVQNASQTLTVGNPAPAAPTPTGGYSK